MSARNRIIATSGWALCLGLILCFASALNPWVFATGVVLPAAIWLTAARVWPFTLLGALLGLSA